MMRRFAATSCVAAVAMVGSMALAAAPATATTDTTAGTRAVTLSPRHRADRVAVPGRHQVRVVVRSRQPLQKLTITADGRDITRFFHGSAGVYRAHLGRGHGLRAGVEHLRVQARDTELARKGAVSLAGLVSPATIAIAKNFGSWLLDKAGGAATAQGVGMIFSLSGLNELIAPDPNTKLLKEIQEQLTEVQRQVGELKTSLNGVVTLLDKDALDAKLINLRENVTTPLDNLFRYDFAEVVAGAEQYEKALESNDPKVGDYYDEMIRLRNVFYNAFDRCCETAPQKIHDFLVPGATTSVLGAYGRLLLHQNRYLTTTQSLQIRALYDEFQKWEELASEMKMERNLPSLDPTTVPVGVARGSLFRWNLARREFLDYRRAESANLPPMIPPGMVVDTGSAVPRAGTSNVTMWAPAGGDLRFEPGATGPGTVPQALSDLNARYAGGFNDWKVPSQAAVTSLLNGIDLLPAKTPGDFLSALDQGDSAWEAIAKDKWPAIWSDDVVTQRTSCYTPTQLGGYEWKIYYPVLTHTAVTTTTKTATWSGRPQIPSSAPTFNVGNPSPTSPSVCSNFIRAQFDGPGALGGLVASRSTGTMPIDYMAQGNGPHLRPSASLRDTDLSGLDLTGIDLSDADLTGSTFTGARFQDIDDATGVNLTGARLTGVTSGGIVGTGTLPAQWTLVDGYLVGPGANLKNADLHGADLRSATLTGVTSGGVDCTGCTLPPGWRWTGIDHGGFLIGPGADLSGQNLSGLDLSNTNFGAATLRGADLSGAVLTNAVFSSADLRGVDFRDSNLTNAQIRQQSDVSGADFTGATLTGLRTDTLVEVGTILPAGWTAKYGFLFGPNVNLSGSSLNGLDLRGVDLSGANLGDADLSGANLTGVNLTNARLRAALLTNAVLTNAILVNVTLTRATITNATFTTDSDNKFFGVVSGSLIGTPKALPASGRYRLVQGYLVGPSANLAGATFSSTAQLGVSLSATNFTGANLTGINLSGATLRNTIFTGARLTNTNLTGADMSNATLDGVISGGIVGTPSLPPGWRVVKGFLVGPGASLRGADLSGVNLSFVDLSGDDLTGANMTGTSLAGANLTGAELSGAVLAGVQWTAAICPDGVRTVVAPCPPMTWLGTSTVRVTANRADGTVLIDVGPDLGEGGEWTVALQKLTESGGWATISRHTTKGTGDTLKINAVDGSYRAVVPPQNRYHGSTSAAVVLAK